GARGLEVRCPQPGLRDLIERAIALKVHEGSLAADDPRLIGNPQVVALAEELIRATQAMPPLDETLRGVVAGLEGRVGDEVTLASGHRRPPAGVGWPVQPGETNSRWLSPPAVPGAAVAAEPRVLSLSVSQD